MKTKAQYKAQESTFVTFLKKITQKNMLKVFKKVIYKIEEMNRSQYVQTLLLALQKSIYTI